ncbi:unnamed protein product [Paramecium octaurelia]|uniref:ADP/ATP translocase n=1 Tax=Paramecium octaurelia TaxID=43137 RepID=A0A8S1WFY7_PAROT|nr:unnamed protein product [Paramecium octaurelia]
MTDFVIDIFVATTSSFISSFCCTPIENIPKSILHNEQKNYLVIWRGIIPKAITYIPHQSLAFAFKDVYSKVFQKKINDYKHLKNILIGSLAGASTMLVMYPYEFVSQRTKYLYKVGKRIDLTWRECLIEILKNDGILGYYRGFSACISPVVVFRGLQFGFYDSTKDITDALPFIGRLFWVQLFTFVSHIISFPFFKIMLMMKADTLNFNHSPVQYKNVIECTSRVLKSQKLTYLIQGSTQRFLLATKDALTLMLYYNIQPYFKGNFNYKIDRVIQRKA